MQFKASDIIRQPFMMAGPGGYQRTREMGLNEMLLENRCLFLDMPLDPSYITNQGTICSVIIKSLLYLDNMKRGSDIHLYINCPGGSVDDTMAIYDTMQFINSDVCTYCIGHAASGAAVILAAGTKGKRFALPHSKVMLHQPWGGVSGQASDIEIQAKEIIKTKTLITNILAEHTGQTAERIQAETERDRYMSADEAKEYGLVDEVLHLEENTSKKTKDSE
ncbi:MAG: ATP-dependent Clp protease proteolytic subunit [Sedimentisphaerales bacterium]|nr:ATP-dependent Clp protease proteolytic subunit [Sedimentisphaerales bacterium]